MKVVIMAGGKGTRIQSVDSTVPKPMLEIGGKPVLQYEIESLREQGLSDIIITVGHLAPCITDYFDDGHKFGVSIEYFQETQPLGNAGALLFLVDKLDEPFLLLNGDVIFDIDFERFIAYHFKHGGLATILVHPNSHPYDSGLVLCDGNKSVTHWLSKEDWRPSYYRNRVNAGVHIINPEVVRMAKTKIGPGNKADLDRDLLKPLVGTGKLFCYESTEYVKDMGTPERFEAVGRDLLSGLVHSRNLHNRQKAILLDRDGTININKGFLTDIDDFELIPGVAEAIRKINESGYLAIVVTNQPVVARGEVTIDELDEIHKKMETLLGEHGAYLDGIYYCPHHPDKGFVGEVPELKIKCECRKPKPGMLLKAAEDFNLDLASCWMVGDSKNDVVAGIAAGCKTAFITDDEAETNADLIVLSLLEFVDKIVEGC